MPAKKPSKAEQERAEAEAAAAKAALEQQAAAEAAAAASSLDALFVYDPALIVPQHDEADISAVLRYHFHQLYQPEPPPTPAPTQPAPVDTKEQQPPPQPTKGTGKPIAKAGKPALKKQPSAVVVEVAPPLVQEVKPVGRAADHPISVLEREWKARDERYRIVESSLLAASSAHTSQQQQLEAQLESLQLLPTIDFPHPPSIPLSPAASIESSERLINLSALTSSVMRELLQRQRPIVRRLPDVAKRPSTRGGSALRVEEEERKEQLTEAQAKQDSRRRVGKGHAPLSDRQRVQRELSRIALAPSQLEVEQRLLRRMREKQRYLANPRSQLSTQHQPHAQQHARGLEADVSDIRFLRYDCGERYERTVRLTNSSHLTQRLSISQPPVGSPFAYTLSSVAAAASLAPGMSVSVLVSFAPCTLASASTVLAVRTEHQTVHIPIVAQRLPSPLSLPPAVTLPACLLQRTVVQRVEVRNDGLRSTFRLVAGESTRSLEQLPPPEQLPSTLQLSDALSVYPAVFELDEGDSITLTLTFAPTSATTASASSTPLTAGDHARLLYTYRGMLAVVTDDGAASYHSLSAEACELALRLVGPMQQPAGSPALVKPRAPFLFGIEQVGLSSCSAATSPSLPCPSTDRLLFPSTLLGSSSAVSVTLCNLSPVSLPFQWLTPFDDRYSSLLPVFHCYPFNGTLHGYEEREMVVTFTPRDPLAYTHSLQLLANEPGHMDLSVAEMTVQGQGRAGRLSMAVEGVDEARAVQRGEWEVWQLRLTSAEPDEVDVEYDVSAAVVCGRAEAIRVQLWPSQGLLSGGKSRLVSVNVQADECSEVVVEVRLAVHPGGLCSTLRLTANVVEQLMQRVKAAVDEGAQQQGQDESTKSAENELPAPPVINSVAIAT